MKTYLYQPIFINPQAYFVFPSLYNTEKGDSFIEPANITGQLIINTLTDDPIILTVKDNNQVDFSIFAGKHIRISQYTDEGAVVLGEWLMPGEPAPVYPDWFNDSLVCWYSPSKQKLTQLDVIESYAEDFTYWTINNTSITSTQKKIVIPASTELEYVIAYRGFNSSTNGFDIKYTGNTVITYRYNKEDDTTGSITINESGIYHLPASVIAQKNFGFYCNPQTTTEEATIEILPTSILKDFSGNGLDAYMYGFQGKLNSGVGIYAVDFTTYNKTSVVADVSHNTVKIVPVASNYLFVRYAMTEMPAYTVNVQNLGNNVLTYQYATENGRREITLTEGINELPESIKTEKDYQVGFRVNAGTGEITITQIPDYPNQLCYSGKEYCISYNQPILTDYTVIADRTWFDKQINHIFANNTYLDDAVNRGFLFEQIKSDTEVWATSFGTNNAVQMAPDGILYQTKNSYNGTPINSGNATYIDKIVIGCYLNKQQATVNYFYRGCHSDFLLFNRTLNEDEINWLKENIYNIEI